MNYKILKLFFVTFLVLNSKVTEACQCPLTELGIKECNKYEIIFKGKIVSVTPCDNKFGIAIFEIEELYKGNAAKEFKVLFECGVECSQEFSEGEEWIIYSNYKQIDKALMNWCSRSRKYFKNDKEDFYAVTYGNDYYEEASFLKKNLGLHRLLTQSSNAAQERNIIPTNSQIIILLLSSLAVIFLFYWLFKKYFKF